MKKINKYNILLITAYSIFSLALTFIAFPNLILVKYSLPMFLLCDSIYILSYSFFKKKISVVFKDKMVVLTNITSISMYLIGSFNWFSK